MSGHGSNHVPSWDGSPETWPDFEIEVDIFVKQAPKWQEPQQIAKLLGALKNQAKSLHAALSEGERDKIVSKEVFKQYLRGHLLETSVPELGRNLRAWQKIRRLPKEGMRLYILRHRQLLSKLEKSVNESDVSRNLKTKLRSIIDAAKAKLVMKERADRLKAQAQEARRLSHSSTGSNQPQAGQESGTRRVWGRSKAREKEEKPDETVWEETDGYDGKWNWQESGWWKGSWKEEKPPEEAKDRLEELGECIAEVELELQAAGREELGEKLVGLISMRWRESLFPENLLGYHLLAGSQLSATERATILSSTSSNTLSLNQSSSVTNPTIALATVEKALLMTWQDRELGERDDRENRKFQKDHKKKKIFSVGESSESESGSERGFAVDQSDSDTDADIRMLESMSDEEEQETFAVAISKKFDAKATYKKSRRTYREAREMVRDIRKSRTGHRNFSGNRAFALLEKRFGKKFGNGGKARSSGLDKNGNRVCFRCGSGDHEIKDCKKPAPGSVKAIEDVEFVFMHHDSEDSDSSQASSYASHNLEVPNSSNETPNPANPNSQPTISPGSNLSGPIALSRPLVEMADESSTSSESDAENNPTTDAVAARPNTGADVQVSAENDLQKKIELMERTNKLRRERLEQQEKLRKLEEEAAELDRRERQLRAKSEAKAPAHRVEKDSKKRKRDKKKQKESRKKEESRGRSRSKTLRKNKKERTPTRESRRRRSRSTDARASTDVPCDRRVQLIPHPPRSPPSMEVQEEEHSRSRSREKAKGLAYKARPPRPPARLAPHPPNHPPPQVANAGTEPELPDAGKSGQKKGVPDWTPTQWREWRLEKAQEDEMIKVRKCDGYESPVKAGNFRKTSEGPSKVTRIEVHKEVLKFNKIMRHRRRSWRIARFGFTTIKRQARLTSKGHRTRFRILALPTWPSAAKRSPTGPLPLVSDEEFIRTYNDARQQIEELRSKGIAPQILINVHNDWLPFPSDELEKEVARERSASPGVSSHASKGDYSKSHDYGVPFDANSLSESEDGNGEKGLPRGDTDDDEEKEKVKMEVKEEAASSVVTDPVPVSSEATGPATIPNEVPTPMQETSEDPNCATSVKDESGNFVVTDHDPNDQDILQTTDNEVYMCVDPGATSTLLKVDDAEKLYSQGKLSCIAPSSKLFRVANGAMMAASTQGNLKVGDRTETAYVIENTSSQQLPVSLLGLPHLTGCQLNLGVEPRLDNISLSRARNGHLYLNL